MDNREKEEQGGVKMVIFPLSWPARIVLILIAIVLGLIFWMMVKPEFWRRVWGKKDEQKEGVVNVEKLKK